MSLNNVVNDLSNAMKEMATNENIPSKLEFAEPSAEFYAIANFAIDMVRSGAMTQEHATIAIRTYYEYDTGKFLTTEGMEKIFASPGFKEFFVSRKDNIEDFTRRQKMKEKLN